MRDLFNDTECAFNVKKGVCSALEVKACTACPFKKTREQLESSRAHAFDRLSRSPHKYALMTAYYGRVLDKPPAQRASEP